jgi:hypothetical protein
MVPTDSIRIATRPAVCMWMLRWARSDARHLPGAHRLVPHRLPYRLPYRLEELGTLDSEAPLNT